MNIEFPESLECPKCQEEFIEEEKTGSKVCDCCGWGLTWGYNRQKESHMDRVLEWVDVKAQNPISPRYYYDC